jgi:hypothetical protein
MTGSANFWSLEGHVAGHAYIIGQGVFQLLLMALVACVRAPGESLMSSLTLS